MRRAVMRKAFGLTQEGQIGMLPKGCFWATPQYAVASEVIGPLVAILRRLRVD